ncbi:hypothetical protein GPALN_007446 [Globodera pallida]|nr:hypothetical protein GPALN_007446 [Globodera pallida]
MQHYAEISRRAFKIRRRAKVSPSGASTSSSFSSSGRRRTMKVDANVVEGRAELVRSAFKMASRVKVGQL